MVHALTPRRTGRAARGLGILITRPARQAGGFAQKIAALGGTPVIFPAIVILPPVDPARRSRARTRRSPTTTIAIFVSANAVEYGAPDPRRWPPTLVAFAPGPGTAEALAAVGIAGARIPATTFDSEGLLALPELADVRGKRVADLSRRRRARAPGRHAARARSARRLRRVLSAREARERRGGPRRGVPRRAGSTRSRSRRAKGSTTCGRSRTTRCARAWRALSDVRPASADRRARARARPSRRRNRGRRRRPHRGVARMGRRATPREELIPCRPTSSSPRRCRRFSTSR